jgi:glycosyltransferase involved in cell wall biosynthesis
MKILAIAPQPFYVERGTPIAIRLLVRALCAAGHHVDLLTYAEGDDIVLNGLRIFRIRKSFLSRNVPIGFSWKKIACDFKLILKAIGLLRKERYEVIHAVEESVFIAAALQFLGQFRIVYDMDSSMADQLIEKWRLLKILSPVFIRFEQFAVNRADLVLPVCNALADKVRAYEPGKAIFVLEDVILDSDEHATGIDNIRDLAGTGAVVALYVGNLEHYQGMDLLLDAMSRLGEGQDLHLVAIGGSTGDVECCRDRVGQLGLNDVVHFLGPKPIGHLMHYLKQADILVSPRVKGKNTPMKIYSYLASGVAVMATRIDSHTQVLDSSFACLVDADANSMATGLKMLAENRDLRARFGAAGKIRALEHHTYEAFQKKLLDAYTYIESL